MFAMKRESAEMSRREIDEARRRGEDLARGVVARYGTSDVFEIVRLADIQLVYRRWPLVTVGDCDPPRALICVNLAAVDCAADGAACGTLKRSPQIVTEAIIAHELGHLFCWRARQPGATSVTTPAAREIVAHRFAESLLDLPFEIEELEELWRDQ